MRAINSANAPVASSRPPSSTTGRVERPVIGKASQLVADLSLAAIVSVSPFLVQMLTSTVCTPSSDRDRWVCTWPLASDRKSTRLNSSHVEISYAVFCLKKKKKQE